MPRIPSYPLIGSLSNNDLLVIDDVSQQYATKSVELQLLKGYFNTGQATTTYVNDKVVSGAEFNTNTGVLTLTRTDGVDVTQNLDGRYALTSSLATVATSGSYNDLSNKPTIPPAYTDADVDTHLNKTASTQDDYVLSLSGNDYTWVAQSGGGGFDGQFSSLTGVPTTIAGYGITDALQLGATSTTALAGNTTTITNTQAAAIVTNSGKTSFPGFGTAAGTALEGNTVIPAAYTDADVDVHLNKDSAGNNEVLSWTGSDYDWVAQSGGGGGGSVTSIATTAPITGGPITTAGSIGISQASASTDGYLSSTDWTTFNAKQSTIEKGAASGYAPLDANQKIPSANLPDSLVGAVVYQGTWNAGTNIPTLPTPAAGNNGHYYIVSDAGAYLGITYAIGDWVISNGIGWEKVDNTQDVNSVFGRVGGVVADANDYAAFYDANVQSNWTETNNASDAFILNKPTTITSNQADEIAANTLKTSFPGFGTTAGTALEGDTSLLQIGTTAGTALEGNTPVIEGTTTSETAITEIKTLTSTEYASETKLNNVMYVIV